MELTLDLTEMQALNMVYETVAEPQMVITPKTMVNSKAMRATKSAGKMADCSVKGSSCLLYTSPSPRDS